MFLGLGPFVSPGEAFLREELSAGPLQWRETEPGVQERGAHAPARVGTVPARSRSARAPGRCPLQRVLGEGRLPHHPPPSQFLGVRESQVAVCGLLGERAFLWVEPRCSRVCPVCPPSPPPPRGARARAGEELTVALPGAGTPLCVPRGFGRDRNQGAALAGAGRRKRGDAET